MLNARCIGKEAERAALSLSLMREEALKLARIKLAYNLMVHTDTLLPVL